MPVYEYLCNVCARSFSVLVFGPAEDIECPHCRSRDIKKKLSSFSCGSPSGTAGPAHTGGG